MPEQTDVLSLTAKGIQAVEQAVPDRAAQRVCAVGSTAMPL